ncbi:hypothetical protein [Ligilactobacillus salivarius]|uniref:hypothetical protein n=1 Tax=Ligilactobacillus salivarius TaxID=1624 RepID=UPI0029669763|nr:hypothetical protein [Ligilactobacillus salivarius]MDW3022888.1 hypothetical protein [Ligilactobacillus salivarius]
MMEIEKVINQRNLVTAAFTAIEIKSVNLAMKAEDDEKKQADAFGELLDFIQQTNIKLNKELFKLEEGE